MRDRLINISILLVLIAGFDLILREWDPIGLQYFDEIDRYGEMRRPDPDFGYDHVPGSRGTYGNVDVVINADGMRGPEFPAIDSAATRDATTRRVLFLGDSIVFGWGAEYDSTFVMLLAKRAPEGVDVIGAGACSWNTRTEWEWLKKRGAVLAPDAVVLVIVQNDVQRRPEAHWSLSDEKAAVAERIAGTAAAPPAERRGRARGFVKSLHSRLVRRSQVVAYITYFATARATRRTTELTEASPEWKDARNALDDMRDWCDTNGVALLPVLYRTAPTVEEDAALRLYDAYFHANGIATVELPHTLMHDVDYRISFVDSHPNNPGHRVIADLLAGPVAALVHQGR